MDNRWKTSWGRKLIHMWIAALDVSNDEEFSPVYVDIVLTFVDTAVNNVHEIAKERKI